MFGLIVAGRAVDISPQEVTQAQFLFRAPATPHFNHIVVFLLPGTVLPAGSAAAVYVQLTPSQEFKFLGGIGAGKESAIFKINRIGSGQANIDDNAMADDQPGGVNAVQGGEIMIGVSIEAGEQVDAQMNALKTSATSSATSTALVPSTIVTRPDTLTTKQLAKNIIGNAFDFLASFGSDTVPLKAFQDWWAKFEKKIDLDPSFLERARDGR